MFRNIDIADYHLDLSCCDWSQVYLSDTVSDKWDYLVDAVRGVLDRHAPVRSVKIRNPSAPPLSAATRDLMARRAAALSSRGHGSDEYRAANRAVRAAVRADSRSDIEGRIAADGPASVWRNLRRVVSGKRESHGTFPASVVTH